MKTLCLLLCAVTALTQSADSAPAEQLTSTVTTESVEEASNTPSPLDLLYQAADDDLNAISFDKSPSPEDSFHNGYDRNPARSDGSSTTTAEPVSSTDLSLNTNSDSTTTESSSTASTWTSSTSFPSTESTETPTEPPSLGSSTTSFITSSESLNTVTTTPSSRIFPTTSGHSTRPPVQSDEDDDSLEDEATPVVDIKTKPEAPKRKNPVRPSVWDAEDERIEKDIITKIFHGAMRNQERIRNRNLRRLLRRFQVLAFRADLSADEFHKFMRLVSEYTPLRIPTFLLRKSERRQFHETNRVRWQHIREQMLRQAGEHERAEVVQTFLSMVERDGALRKRFGRPRRTHMNFEEFLRRQAPLMRRILLPSHIEDHPLVRELLGGRRPPSPFFMGCCD